MKKIPYMTVLICIWIVLGHWYNIEPAENLALFGSWVMIFLAAFVIVETDESVGLTPASRALNIIVVLIMVSAGWFITAIFYGGMVVVMTMKHSLKTNPGVDKR
jgi:hypothetical protein